MKHDIYIVYAVSKIEELRSCEVESVGGGAAPTQYLSELASANTGSSSVISSALSRLIGLAKSACGNLSSSILPSAA